MERIAERERDMEKLTRREIVDDVELVRINKGAPEFIVYEKLAEYEDAEEQGLLLRLPIAVGSTIWFVGTEFINDYEVRRYIVDESGVDFIQIAKEIDGRDYWNSFSIDDIGKTVFLTKEEAEQVLADMKKGK